MVDENNGDGLSVVEQIYDSLERGDPADALRIARAALTAGTEDDPVLQYLCGVALIEFDRPWEALPPLERACELDEEDAEFRAAFALALFRSCRFDEAARQAERALESDDTQPDACSVLALVAERHGRHDDADRQFARAARLDPERFSVPIRFDGVTFDREIARAVEKLPDKYRALLDNVTLTVDDLPADSLLHEEQPPLDPELLGLFVGVPLSEQSSFSPGGEMPPRILLFKRNLERLALQSDELNEEIAITVYHELGHYLGLDEEELEDLGFG
jgi:predicted Zn-dependent protease with MMP-like domain